MKHKHADLIHAWADGAEIEFYDITHHWVHMPKPNWVYAAIYRVKPELNPDVVRDAPVYPDGSIGLPCPSIDGIKFGLGGVFPAGIIRITIDGETGKLSAEVVE